MTMALLPSAADAADAKQFMRGGEYCFRIGTVIPGGCSAFQNCSC
jgi:hypothetical protein